MPARCLIVDDEDLARQQITRLLAAQPDFQVIGEARNGVEALELIPELKPEVVFLDIEMPGLSGFDMLIQLRESPLIVFATAYDEYAIRASTRTPSIICSSRSNRRAWRRLWRKWGQPPQARRPVSGFSV